MAVQTIEKEVANFGVPWEKEYGYSQAVKVGDTIYVAGQVSHDEQGNFVGIGNMELQMRQAYTNASLILAQFGATLDNVVEEILFVTDMRTAFPARIKLGKEFFTKPSVASTIIQITALAQPEFMIEIKFIAKLA
jgi:enamine deaminase RidA (YjgF/YER057c/UK114 family)